MRALQAEVAHTAVESGEAVDRFDELSEQFFSQPPPASDVALEAWEPTPLSASERRAMRATGALLASAVMACVTLLCVPEALGVAPAQLNPEPLALEWRAPRAVEPVEKAHPAHAGKRPELPAREAPAAQSQARPRSAALRQPASTPHSKMSRAAEQAKRASRMLDRGDLGQARALANGALALDSTQAHAYVVLGSALGRGGDRDAARAAFERCVREAVGPLVQACRTLAR